MNSSVAPKEIRGQRTPELSGVVELITPDMALEYLVTSIGNRPLRNSHVERLTGIIVRGEWKVMHQGIAFDAEGCLVDGHHRLEAVMASGISVPIYVVRGVPRESFEAMDQQRVRTVHDQIGGNKRDIEIARWLFKAMTASEGTVQQIRAVLSVVETPTQALHAAYGTSRKGVTRVPVRAAAVMAMMTRRNTVAQATSQYAALAKGDLENCVPSVRALFAKLMTGSGDKTETYIYACARLAFDQSAADHSQISVRDPNIHISELRRFLEPLYKHAAATLGAPAAPVNRPRARAGMGEDVVIISGKRVRV